MLTILIMFFYKQNSSCVVVGQADNLGTEFMVIFMRNDVENPINSPLEIFITTPSTIPVQVILF